MLVVGRIPNVHQNKCIIEPFTLKELETIPERYKAVWNSRDLKDGSLKKEAFEEARNIFKGFLIQASNIKTVDDVKEGADAVLVGQNIECFDHSMK